MTGLPGDIFRASDYERHAAKRLDPAVFAFLTGGAGRETTRAANRAALDKVQIYNRVLTDVSAGHTRTEICGQGLRHPILLAPVAFQKLYHSDGELASAQAAEATDTCMILSTLSSAAMEDVAEVAGPRWFQLYFQPRREDTLSLVRRAEASGYQALVVTVDSPIIALSPAAAETGFQMPPHIRAVHLDSFEASQPAPLKIDDSPIFQGAMTVAPSWDDLEWIIANTSLPVLVKGVSHPDDAQRAIETGASGVVVSTHAGRTLDGLPGALELVPAVRARLGPECVILFDSGIRSGRDVFKALALGADAVLIGQMQAFGLSVAGALGVAHMIKLMREELELTMALTGCASLDEIDASKIVNADHN